MICVSSPTASTPLCSRKAGSAPHCPPWPADPVCRSSSKCVVAERLPEEVEVGVYYVVSEAITNAIKHAEASEVRVDLEADDTSARLRVRDDGVGGADLHNGTGLVGLRDRVHALGGRLDVTSPPDRGTQLRVVLPLTP